MTGPQDENQRKRFEYLVEPLGKTLNASILNPYGQEGWALVTIVERSGQAFYAIFQREIL